MTHSEFTRRTGYAALVAFQCLCNKSRLKVIDLFFQSSAYQFLNTVNLLQCVHDYAAAAPQTFKLCLTCGATDKLICPAKCGQQFSSRKHAPEIFYHPELGHGS